MAMLLSSFSLLLLCVGLICAEEWHTLSTNAQNALRSQRDVSANITIGQLTNPGVSLSPVVFDYEGYTLDSMNSITSILDLNVQTLLIDLYWNENMRKFQLCPVEFDNDMNDFNNMPTEYFEKASKSYRCQIGITLNNLAETIARYLKGTDTNLDAGILVLLFNLHYLDNGTKYDASLVGSSNDTLSSIMRSYFNDRLYTPTTLTEDQEDGFTFNSEFQLDPKGYPNLTYFLYQRKSRVISSIMEYDIPSNSSYSDTDQNSYIFNQTTFQASLNHFSTAPDLLTEDSLDTYSSQSWRYVYDTPSSPFSSSEIYEMISNGFSPIINHSFTDLTEIASVLNSSMWSWNATEPLSTSTSKKIYEDQDNEILQKAYQCASTNITGTWYVSNCYRELPAVCRNESNQFDWVLNTNEVTYFHAPEACENGFIFTVPKTALQQKSLNDYLIRINANGSVWIDMNSIAIQDCWVSGGPYASCPYQTVTSSRNYVDMLTPATVLALCILLVIIAVRLKSVPLQKNKKTWKRLVNKYAENEYEGVPS